MAEFPAFPLWTDAYLADTTELTTLEHGAYLLLLIAMWRAGGSLPDDDAKLARFTRLGPKQWASMRQSIGHFFKVENGRLTQGRLLDELEKARSRSKKASDSARAKYRKTNTSPPANAKSEHSPATASTTTSISITNKEEDTSLRSVAPQAASTRKRGTRLDENWVLPKAMGEWALEQGLPRDRILLEAQKMRDWSINAGAKGAKVDWFAAWRNWVQKAIDELPANKAAAKPLKGLALVREQLRQEIENEGFGGEESADNHPVRRLAFNGGGL